MKKILLVSFLSVLGILQLSAQTTALAVTATVTPATVCTAPCNGTATAIVSGGTAPYTYLWNIPSNPQQTQTATGLCPGQYQVGVWDATTPFPNQGTTLVTVTCNTASGITTVSLEENISIFPNPAFDQLNLEINAIRQGNTELIVRNILGAVAYSETLEANGSLNRQVDISALPVGIYTVEFLNGERGIRSKFIKQ